MPYWFNVTTRQVESHDDPERAPSADLLGPYDSEAEATAALDKARQNTEDWDAEDREWDAKGADPGGPTEAPARIEPVDDTIAERVLRAVEQIPRGQVASYGDIAGLVGIGPRQVGSVMRAYGGNVTWWRVTSSYGDLPGLLLDQARPLWAQEGILVKPNGRGCRIADYRADLRVLADAYFRAVADLPTPAHSG